MDGSSIRKPSSGIMCAQTILWGYLNDHPAGTEEGYLAFAKSLASPSIYDRLQKMEPVSRILRFNRTENFRRYYDKASRGRCLLLGASRNFAPALSGREMW